MSPYISILGFNLQAYPLLLLLAAWAGLWLAARQAERLGMDGDHIYNLGFYALLAALLGARLAYVLTHWSAYQGALLSAFSPTPTAFNWPEGLVVGLLVALVYGLRYRLPASTTLDALAPGLALALALERLGAFLDGRNFGEPTSLPWGVTLWGEVRHPVQVYEMVALLLISGLLLWQQSRRPYPGHTFALFVALYAGSRLFLEAFRADAPLITGGLRSTQLIALAVMLGAVWYLYSHHFALAQPAVTADTQESETLTSPPLVE
jgi:phosphatidylglycerol:prolipoprotein diacylglycerol transferase